MRIYGITDLTRCRTALMMLNHLADTRGDESCRAMAELIKAAYNRALQEGKKTRDLGGTLGTEAFTDAVIEHLQ